MDDRYRGISNGRRVILINQDDAAELGFQDRELVDVISTFQGHGTPGGQVPAGVLPHPPRVRGGLLPGSQRAGASRASGP